MGIWTVLAWLGRTWDRILFYGCLVVLVLLIRSFQEDIAAFSRTVREDTQFLQRPEKAHVLIEEAWVQGLIRRAQGADALAKPRFRNLFSVVKEQKMEPAPVVREPQSSVPTEGAARFELVKIYRQPVRLLFKGYLQQPDGTYSLQINWAGKTDFKLVGESIRGYRIEQFEKVIVADEVAGGYTREQDNSYVVIHKDPDGPVTIQKGKLVTEKELFARIYDRNANETVVAHVGSQLGQYKVIDITEDEVLLSDPANQEIRLKHAR